MGIGGSREKNFKKELERHNIEQLEALLAEVGHSDD
jgi:hypothetical protein